MDEKELIRKAQHLIRRWDNTRIIGARGEWSGSARQGFAFNPKPIGGGGTGGGPIIPTGACCIDGNCSILTEDNCIAAGGDYQGDGTDCDPNPCPPPPTGACCVGEDCTIETEDDCTGMGGVYQGDDTGCDPNPCGVLPECSCGFDAFDLSGRKFLRYQRTILGHYEFNSPGCPDGYGEASQIYDGSATFEQHFEVGSCDVITDTDESSSSRSGTCNGAPDDCSLSSMECFCNVVIPEHNACSGFFDSCCQCGHPAPTSMTDATATTRTTTFDFASSCDHSCDPDPDNTCERSGYYIVTETLSEECIPI